MRCKEVRSIVDEARDLDRLPLEAARHVASCEACERFGRDLAALRALLREPGRVSAPPDFDAGLARRLRAAQAPAPPRAPLAWFAVPTHLLATAAGVGLVAFGTFTVVQTVSRPTNSNPTNQIATIPTNASAPMPKAGELAPGVSTAAPPSVAVNVSAPPAVRASRPASRQMPPRPSVRDDLPDQAMLLVSDGRGTRVVSVPTVLVGSERVVPTSVGVAASSGPVGVAF
jgi:hypothetical protein